MLYAKNFISAGMICSAVLAAAVLTGCRSATIPVSVTVPGEFNLSGISKIAMVNFNTIPSDPLTGVYAADAETRAIVQNMVASAFYKSKMYQVANLDIEKSIASAHSQSKIVDRYNAVIYGRLWWQISPEYRISYPKKFTLETWANVRYSTGQTNPITKKPIYAVAHVTRRMRDVLENMYFRAWNANLMLSLSIYKINHNGLLEKTTETFAVASQNFLVDNGSFSTEFVPIGEDSNTRANRLKADTEKKSTFGSLFTSNKIAKDVSGRFVAVQKSTAIPAMLQMKLMLGEKLATNLVNRFTPSQIVFNLSCDFSDDKLFNLMKDGAFKGVREYVNYTIRKNAGNKIAEKIDPLDDPKAYPVPKFINPAKDPEKITDKMVVKAAKNHIEYLYALAISEEAMGEYDRAVETYRYIFKLDPAKEYAQGISRCLFALGMNDRVNEKARAKRDAAKKASLK